MKCNVIRISSRTAKLKHGGLSNTQLTVDCYQGLAISSRHETNNKSKHSLSAAVF